MAVFLKGASVLRQGGWQHGAGVLIEGGQIAGILPETAAHGAREIQLPTGSLLAPGLIDVQVNGGGGMLFNDDPCPDAARAIAAAHRALGTTSILPTLITDSKDVFDAAIGSAACPPGVVGLHLEGPFLSPARPGVHLPAYIRPPSAADLDLLTALAARLPGRVLLTVAPECVPDSALHRLNAAGVLLSAGHTASTVERVAQAVAAGLSGFTHLFNAMPPLGARDPGPAAAALLHPQTWCGVIADGVHVSAPMMRLLRAARGLDRVMLVSDSMPPAGTDLTSFVLQGRKILRCGGRLETEDGTLAGADISLLDAVCRARKLFGVPLAAALGMASEVPAAFLKLPAKGRIEPDFDADLLLLDDQIALRGTWLAGRYQGSLFASGEADAGADTHA